MAEPVEVPVAQVYQTRVPAPALVWLPRARDWASREREAAGELALTIVRPALAKSISNSIAMKLVLVLPGKFTMGSPLAETNRGSDEQQHEVEISKPFYLGVYEVTQEEYGRVMGGNPSYFCASGSGQDKVQGMNTRRFPVETISWNDAVEFCGKLSELVEEKKYGRVYRLPTEAEWEYACRAGTTTVFHYGNSLSSEQANFNGDFPYGGAAKRKYLARPSTVGSYQANAFGLYDMHGNVWEWCNDWYEEKYYSQSPRRDPEGPQTGNRRVLRGGSWSGLGMSCRAAYRNGYSPGDRYDLIGFRVASVAAPRTQ